MAGDLRVRQIKAFTLICDGHVEARKIEAFFNISDSSIRKSWNNDNQPHREMLPRSLLP